MGSRRFVRQNAVVSRVAPSLQGSTMAQAMPSKLARARAQASHSHAPRIEQPAPATQPAPIIQLAPAALPTPATQPAPVIQPAHVAQLAPAALPSMVSQTAQVGPRISQLFGATIEPGAFSPYFSADLTFPNSNLAPGVYHTSTAQGGTFLLSSSNPNGKQHLSRQVIELTSALAQQTTLVNQLLQHTKIQRAPDKVSRSRTRADKPLH
ncbi:uncharacterized protein [Malus domestica]|uniref:uncharacterized protein n=1 Tax=Malus domestica TaxID=3750 RepID=UPI003976C1EA